MKRRKILTWLGLGFSLSWLNKTLTGCSETSTTGTSEINIQANSSIGSVNPEGYLKVGSIQELKTQERLIVKQSNGESLLVIQTKDDAAKVYAVDSRCSHQGCQVDWNTDTQKIICPCHGSTFKANGEAIAGAANEPLKSFEAKIEGEDILIKV